MSISTDFRSLLAKRIKQLRKKAGLNQGDLAAKLKLSRQAISDYEVGRHAPSMDILLNLARFLKVHPATLFLNHDISTTEASQSLREIFAANVSILLSLNYMSVTEAAEHCGIGRSSLYLILAKGSSPALDMVEKIAKAFEIAPMDLLKDWQSGDG